MEYNESPPNYTSPYTQDQLDGLILGKGVSSHAGAMQAQAIMNAQQQAMMDAKMNAQFPAHAHGYAQRILTTKRYNTLRDAQFHMPRAGEYGYVPMPPITKQYDTLQDMKDLVELVAIILKRDGPIDIGGGVLIKRMEVIHLVDKFEDSLWIHISTPDGDEKMFTGNIEMFGGCIDPKSVVLRALGVR